MSQFSYRNVGLSLLLSAALVSSASAGTPGQPCRVEQCAKWCGEPGAVACSIRVLESGPTGNAVSKVDQPTVCVYSGTEIFWYTLELNSELTVTFGAGHPFPNTPSGQFKGKKGQPSGDTAVLPSSTAACYQYSVEHCNKHGQCAHIDPKVIVTNVRDGH
jgi:hypothetical protein